MRPVVRFEQGIGGPFLFPSLHTGDYRAVVLQFDMEAVTRVGVVPLILGFASSALVGFMALTLLMGIVKKGHFYYFAPYCWAVGIFTIIFTW